MRNHGEKFQYNLKSGEYIPKYSSGNIHKLKPTQFDASSNILKGNHPKNGRFYPTDFFSDHPFEKQDSKDDGVFYELPRLVGHIDRQASKVVSGIYEKVLKPDMKVLDLMSSWQSHMPKGLKVRQLSGLGMNAVKMEK